MKHLILRLTINSTELVDSSCINDLYEFTLQLALDPNPDNTSYLLGKISTNISSKDKINVLHTLDDQNPPVPVTSNNEGKWNDLFVTATTYSVDFKDNAFKTFIELYLNGGNEFTSSSISSYAQDIVFRNATAQPNVQSLDDLALFTSVRNIYNIDNKFPNATSITVSRSCQSAPIGAGAAKLQHFASLNGNINISLEKCPELEDVTAPSYTSIKLYGCTKLKNVNIENVPVRTELSHGAISNCTSLEDLDFIPEEFTVSGTNHFQGLTQLESLPISTIWPAVPANCYYECRAWKGDAIFAPITTTFNDRCLAFCTSLTSIIITATSGVTANFNGNFGPFDANPYGASKKGCPIYVPLAAKDSIIQGDTGMTNYSQGDLLAGSTEPTGVPSNGGRVFGYRILRHDGSSWQNVSDFGTGKAAMDLVKEARKNTVFYNNTTDVPSTGSNGDLAFAVYVPLS